MKRLKSLFVCVILMISCIFGACADSSTSGNDGTNYFGSLHYSSSDQRLADFLNDYWSRHVRDGENAIGTDQLVGSVGFNRHWIANGVVWYDSTSTGLSSYNAMNNIRTSLSNITIDRFGNVYNQVNMIYEGTVREPTSGQGWPFPHYAMGNLNGYGVNFNGTNSEGWTINGDEAQTDGKGFLTFNFSGSKNETLFLKSDKISGDSGMETSVVAPFIEIDLRIEDLSSNASANTSDVADFNFCWKTSEGGDTWFKVSNLEFSTMQQPFSSYSAFRVYFPMFLDENWDGKHVTEMGIEIVPKEGKRLNITGKMNYLYMICDTRISISGCTYLIALEDYVKYNNDVEFAKSQITRARKAILFQLEHLQGKNGLVNLSYLRGHDLNADTGYLCSNGFWDIYATGNRNCEANLYFYKALKALANLEQFLIDAGVSIDETASVSHPYFNQDGNADIVYKETVESLNNLADTVKRNICKNVSDGGFWNPETGRFVWALYDDNPCIGEKDGPMDYGFTELNLQLIAENIASEDQSKSIMQWLNGERIVEGDNSKGEDIYFYEFAPRSVTKHIVDDYTIVWAGKPYGQQCQDGGTMLHIAYFDLMARAEANSIDDFYSRIKKIQSWYEDVQIAGGEGEDFYSKYYVKKMLEAELNGANGKQYTLQGGGPSGALGLTYEFGEAIILSASIPDAMFGLKNSTYNTLCVSPAVPSTMDWFELDNLMFSKIKYDCKITQNSVEIKNVRGNVNGQQIRFEIPVTKQNYTVKINGNVTTKFSVEDGKIIVTVPMAQVTVSVE